jgi:hypothetical protein
MVTVFKNIRETSTPFYRQAEGMLDRIREGKNRDQVEAIRAAADKGEQNKLKAALPSICWSGRFPQRNDASILEHSGLICLDFDGLGTDAQRLRDKLIADPHTWALFTSPGGDGLKVLVRIPPDPQDHRAYFDALAEHYDEPSFDSTSGNVSRVCYTSYDPDLYHNPEATLWVTKKEKDWHDMATRVPEVRLHSRPEIIRRLLKWWTSKYGLVPGQRNSNAYLLARSFNRFGVPQIEARGVLMDMAHEGFDGKEIDRLLVSAYSNTAEHGTCYFEDTVTRDHIQRLLVAGESKSAIKATLADRLPPAEAEAAINIVERSSPWIEFWERNDRGQVVIINHKFRSWLEHNGFRKLYPEGSETFVLVRVENNLISNVSADQVKDYVLQYLEQKVPNIAVWERMAGQAKYFAEDYLSMLSPIEAAFVQDSQEQGMLYYRNCAVQVTAAGVQTIDYIDLDGYVWQRHIVDRDWTGVDIGEEGVFKRFVHLIAGGDAERERSLRSTIGYLLHSFKTSAKNKAVILNDEQISDNPNGGSGKGLFCQGIARMKRLASLDGKIFSFDKSFPYQTVGADTQVLVFDDVDKYFRFERTFSLITEGMTLEKKNKDAVRLPVERSPKIVITTNYTVGGVGGSYERRKWEVELSAHFNSRHTPQDEFGHLLFDEWDILEWARFDAYMVGCLSLYLQAGLVAAPFKNLKVRKFIKETSHEFWEWCTEGNLDLGPRHSRGGKFAEFCQEYPDYKDHPKVRIAQKKFTSWMAAWGTYNGWEVGEYKDPVGNRCTYYIGEEQPKEEPKDCPF